MDDRMATNATNASKLPLMLLSAVLALVIVLLAVGVVFSAYLFAHNVADHAPRGFVTVSATGGVYAVPSESAVSILANATGTTAHQAVENLSLELNSLNSTLYNYVGANMSRITTSSYSVFRTHNATTYTAQEGITATLPNASRTGALLGSLSSIPNIYVSGVSAQLSNSQAAAMRGSALSAALTNATQQAEALAAPYNITLVNVSVSNYYVYPYSLAEGVGSSGQLISGLNVSPTYYQGRSMVQERISAIFSYS